MWSLLPKELLSYSSKKTTTANTVTSAPVNKGRSATANKGRTTVVFDSSKPSSTAGVTSAGTTTNTAVTRQQVTVQQMEHLYDSHMIISQGIKLKWMRNRMMT